MKLLGPSDSRPADAPFRISVETPNDPEHWAYGEEGPTFDLAILGGLLSQRALDLLAYRPAADRRTPPHGAYC